MTASTSRCRWAAVSLLLVLLTATAVGQQSYVTRYDVFTGYAYLNSPRIGLAEHGFQTQFGVRPFTWMSLGFDYAVARGDLALTPDLLLPATQQALAAQLGKLTAAGLIPAGYKLLVPAGSVTHTFAAGPQFAYRHFKQVTLFIRPSCGIIKESATPNPTDAIAKGVVAQLAPEGVKNDNAIFYGVGGGIDFNFSRHVGLRVQGDFVRDHLFDDLLKDARNTVRFSIGPCFNFGPNISHR
jgi:hypothetical protein